MDIDLVPNIQDSMVKLGRLLRKRFSNFFEEKINYQIRKYFKLQIVGQMVEPRDIKGEFLEIAKLLKQAAICLDTLTVGVVSNIVKKATMMRGQ